MDTLLQCLGRLPRSTCTMRHADENVEGVAIQIVDTLYDGENHSTKVKPALRGIFLANSWKPNLAQATFLSLQKEIKAGRPMGGALQEIYENVARETDSTKESVSARSEHCAITTLGILVLISPWKIEALGFSEREVLEGKSLPSLEL